MFNNKIVEIKCAIGNSTETYSLYETKIGKYNVDDIKVNKLSKSLFMVELFTKLDKNNPAKTIITDQMSVSFLTND